MQQKLQEWASGRAGWVTGKVYAMLTKYTGVKFKVCPTFHSYKNKWGVFIGKVALGSNGRFYRLNFLKGKTEQIVSMDVWNKGLDPQTKMPSYTCSLEGFGIGKVITMLKDFILTPEKVLTEGVENEDAEYAPLLQESVLNESSDELKMFIKDFLLKNPSWQKIWASGNVDPKQYFDDIKVWIKANTVNGVKYSNNPPLTTIGIMNNTKTLIKKDPSALGNLAGSASNAQSAPSIGVIKGTPETPIDLSDIYADKVTFDKVQSYLADSRDGPVNQMIEMAKKVNKLIDMGDMGKTMLVIWGRGGIGKTRTLRDVLEEKGMSKGNGYVMMEGLNNSSDNNITKWIINNRDVPVVVINDSDKIFQRPALMNMWKKVLEHDPKWGRHLQIEYPPNHRKAEDEPEAGDYEIECKFIWLSNFNPDTVFDDDSGAMKSRYFSVRYDFTDKEVLGIISSKLSSLFPEYEDTVTLDDKARLLYLYYQAAVKREALGVSKTDLVSFRQFSDDIQDLWYTKVTGGTFDEFFNETLKNELNVFIK